MKRRAIAFSNNDIALVCWEYEKKIDDCLGFAVFRIGPDGKKTALPASVGFKGDAVEKDANGRPIRKDVTIWPVQRFKWRDFFAHRGGTFSYEIVPMVGTPGALTPRNDLAVRTKPVALDGDLGNVTVYFNRGIISTQAIANAIPRDKKTGKPQSGALLKAVATQGNPVRDRLSGNIRDNLFRLIDRAVAEKGSLLAALYELEDDELIAKLISVKDRIEIVLSNTGDDDKRNKPGRKALKKAGVTVHDRMLQHLNNNAIGHNKFLVLRDSEKRPIAFLSGSTNWTSTGMCTQTNNSVVVESPKLAVAYQAYWERLKASKNDQPVDKLRIPNQKPEDDRVDGGIINVWYSPNTKAMSKSSKSASPLDLQEVHDLLDKAEQMILFLMFKPGAPNIAEMAAKVQERKPKLVVYGAATDPEVRRSFNVNLTNRDARKEPDKVLTVSAINDDFAFWTKELLSAGAAVIHDKIVVIDPMSKDKCVVVTGSHNLGYKASYSNDENMLIIRGHQPVALAYATHVIDVYDHFRWRFLLQEDPELAEKFDGLNRKPDWQNSYFKIDSKARQETAIWLSGTPFQG
jgi:phosphatidylserine/phosphatidylglycerophosphate/cardiolipin synthase-like enzyme